MTFATSLPFKLPRWQQEHEKKINKQRKINCKTTFLNVYYPFFGNCLMGLFLLLTGFVFWRWAQSARIEPQENSPTFLTLKWLLNNKSFDVISLGASLMPLQSGVYCIWSYMHSVTSNTLVLPFLDLGEISRLSEPTDMNTSIHAFLQTLENHWDCISDQKTITDNQTKYVASLSRRRSRSRYKHMQRKTETLRVVYLRSLT